MWDLTAYLFPSSSSSSYEHYTDRPILHPGGLGAAAFPRQLQPGDARLHPQALVQKGWPRLSLQVSDRALNSIAFTSEAAKGRSKTGPSLVLAGDEGIFVYDWRTLLALLQQEAPTEGPATVPMPPPKARLCALPAGAARSWPYLTESNQVAVAEGGKEAYSAVCVSGCLVCVCVGFFFTPSPQIINETHKNECTKSLTVRGRCRPVLGPGEGRLHAGVAGPHRLRTQRLPRPGRGAGAVGCVVGLRILYISHTGIEPRPHKTPTYSLYLSQ